MARMPKPVIVGYYDNDADNNYSRSTKLARYLCVEPNDLLPVQLNAAHGLYAGKHPINLNSYYKHMAESPALVATVASDSVQQAGIITTKSSLLGLWHLFRSRRPRMFVPPRLRIVATLLGGVVYLSVGAESWYGDLGQNFRTAMQSETPTSAPSEAQPLKRNAGLNLIFSMMVGQDKVLYKDCPGAILARSWLHSRQPLCEENEEAIIADLRTRRFVKFKTTKLKDGGSKFRKLKTQDIWFQNFLCASETLVGFRNGADQVEKARLFDLQDLEQMNPQIGGEDFFNEYLVSFLFTVKQELAEKLRQKEDPKPAIVEVYFKTNFHGEIVQEPHGENYIPDWYIEYVLNK